MPPLLWLDEARPQTPEELPRERYRPLRRGAPPRSLPELPPTPPDPDPATDASAYLAALLAFGDTCRLVFTVAVGLLFALLVSCALVRYVVFADLIERWCR